MLKRYRHLIMKYIDIIIALDHVHILMWDTFNYSIMLKLEKIKMILLE